MREDPKRRATDGTASPHTESQPPRGLPELPGLVSSPNGLSQNGYGLEEPPMSLSLVSIRHEAETDLTQLRIHGAVDLKFPRWGEGCPIPTFSKVTEDVLWVPDQTVVVASVTSDAKTGCVVGSIRADS